MNDQLLLSTEHHWAYCDCTEITRIIDVTYPVKAEIHVRACAEVSHAPLRSAMDALSQAIGRNIISESYADELIRRYSSAWVGHVLQNVQCVLAGGFSRRYYLYRDIMEECGKNPIPKCMACGRRDCRDASHEEAERFARSASRYQDGYVYFLLHNPVKFLKVGYSATPVKRLKTHRTSIPGELTTLGVVPGGRCMEHAIHGEIGHWLVPGHKEWFFYSEFVKDYIDRIIAVYKDTPQV